MEKKKHSSLIYICDVIKSKPQTPNYEVGYKVCTYFNVMKNSDTFKPKTNCLKEKLEVD